MTEAIVSHRPSLVEVAGVPDAPEAAGAQQQRPIVVVLGPHRSGTSLCSHVLGVLGVDIADVVNAHDFNAKGEWERWELTRLHDRVLELFDRSYGSPHHDLPLPVGWWADPRVRAIQEVIGDFLRRRMPEGALFGFKDPRTARLLPLWQQLFEELKLAPKIVLCVRNPAQVARSLATRDGLDPEIGEYRWFTYMIEALGNLQNYDLCTIEYEDWFLSPQVNIDKLQRFLELQWRLPAMELRIAVNNIVDAGLRHDAIAAVEPHQPLVRSLYNLARSYSEDRGAREEAGRLVEQFAAYRELHLPHFREFERVSNAAAKLQHSERRSAALQEDLSKARQRSDDLERKLRRAEDVEHKLSEATQRGEDLQRRLDDLTAREAELAEAGRAAEAALAAATQRGSELQQELGLTRERLDRAERMAAQFEEISEAAQSAINALRARLGQAETERGELLEKRERIAAERDQFAKERDQIIEDRIWVAEDRDRIAAARDRIAEERDRLRSTAERLAEERDQFRLAADELARERDEVGEAGARWFDAAVLAPADRLAGRRRSRGWRIGKYVVKIGRRRGRGSPMGRADKARDAGQWERAACSYLEALEQVGPRPAILVQLGHVLKEAGKAAAAETAYRRAADLDKTNVDALVPLAQLLCRRERYDEAAQVFQQALEHCTHPEKRAYISGELASFRPLADPSPAATAAES